MNSEVDMKIAEEALSEKKSSARDTSKVITYQFPEETAEDQIILTGDRCTGPLHLGHYFGSLKARVNNQYKCKQYILIADVQALTDNFNNPEKVRSNVIEVMLDYLAVGIDPKLTTIYIASAIPETAELTLYFLNLINIGKLSRNPTVKHEIKLRGFGEEVPTGFLIYPVNQAADITQFKATLVPVGLDQVPMIELANDLVGTFNSIYKTNILKSSKALLSETLLLPGIDGQGKMSKSLGNAIYLGDDPKEVSAKVKKMYTDPNHIKVEDPGTVEGNTVFTYLDAFDSDKEAVETLKADYRKGGLGDGVVKKRLEGILQDFMEPIRLRRSEYAKDRGEVMRMLHKSTEYARSIVAENIRDIRRAIGIQYW
jgi:tryptophanyl-tRNA synthetase